MGAYGLNSLPLLITLNKIPIHEAEPAAFWALVISIGLLIYILVKAP